MKNTGPGGAAITLALVVAVVPLAAREPVTPAEPKAQKPVQARPAEFGARGRALAIVRHMTLDEKIGLVHGIFPPMSKG
jgi:beta-glucosidase